MRRWVPRKTPRLPVVASLREPGRQPTSRARRVEGNDWDPQSANLQPPRPPIRPSLREEESPNLSNFTNAITVGAFVLGIGAGVYFTSEVTLEPSNVASTEIVDRRTPNSEVCMANGYSSMVFDQRLFVSFNP